MEVRYRVMFCLEALLITVKMQGLAKDGKLLNRAPPQSAWPGQKPAFSSLSIHQHAAILLKRLIVNHVWVCAKLTEYLKMYCQVLKILNT